MAGRRRYSVRVCGHVFYFHYRFGQGRYKFSFDEELHEGFAASLGEAKRLVKQIIRARRDEK